MSEPPQPGPKQRVNVEGDELVYYNGCLTWYFQVIWNNQLGLYAVSRAEFYLQIPTWDTLLLFRVQDRHRLHQWLLARQAEADREWRYSMETRLVKPKPKQPSDPGQYDPRTLEAEARERAFYEQRQKERADQLNEERRAIERRIASKPVYIPTGRKNRKPPPDFAAQPFHPCGAGIANFLSDHQWIESMFWIYSQERFRLL